MKESRSQKNKGLIPFDRNQKRQFKKFFKGVDVDNLKLYHGELDSIIDSASVTISNVPPSVWCEENRMMPADVSPVPGMFSYKNSPYTREIIDRLSVNDSTRVIAVMKGAQIGFSAGVIEGGIGWIISNAPGNVLFLVGHDDLVSDAMKKIDSMIDNSGLRHLIKSTSKRVRNTKSGDTDKMKEFPQGFLKLGISNHKTLRQQSIRYGFIDDFDAMKAASKESGDTLSLVLQRFAAFSKKMKLFLISTPELEATSNIEPAFKLGDQRKYFIPCPCCGEFITLEWSVQSDHKPDDVAGITWKLNDANELIEDSVGYTCQKCGGFFDDRNKSELIQLGEWQPTAQPKKPGYKSYHISSLYAPVYMFDWAHYVYQYLEANPPEGKRNEQKWKTFQNLVLGETYSPSGESVSANELQLNIRPYKRLTIPGKLSAADGNGPIVMVTCGSDLNGKEDDARLDYEIVAHSASGATYSIDHGSIGTFVPREKVKTPREKFTYRHGAKNSVWPLFQKIIGQSIENDLNGKKFKIFMTGVDAGYQTTHAYQFVDNNPLPVVSLKGKDDDKFIPANADLKTYRKSKEKPKLYLVETNHTKDVLADYMRSKWDANFNDVQPMGFMNFPEPSDGRYQFKNYFSHFEAEEKIIDKAGRFRWVKKTQSHQNHLFDCRLYANVVRDIFVDIIFAETKVKNGLWQDFVDMVTKKTP